jgi:hypothetical protein
MIVQLLHPQTSSSTNPKSQPMHAGDGEAAGFHVGGGRILRSSINQRDQHHSKSEPAQLCSASFCRGPSRSLRRSAARSQPNRAALVLRWLTRPGYRSQASSIHVACPLPRFAEPFILLGSPLPITALRRSRKSALTTSCQRDRSFLATFVVGLTAKHLLQCERSVDNGADMHLCLMLALGITYAQHLGAANQYAPPPEIMSWVVNDRIFNAAMLHEFATGTKRCCSEE